MNIAIIGYGKMGHLIHSIATALGHRVVLTADMEDDERLETLLKSSQAEVAIEFSIPSAAVGHLLCCFRCGIPVVCGTTGWTAEWERVASLCEESRGGLFYASNYSIGMNLFMDLNRRLAQMMAEVEGYRPSITEWHHIHKLDAPSGTAISLANAILDSHPAGVTRWELTDTTPSAEVLPIRAVREGEIPGTHTITYESAADRISIIHEAFSREGFARGAVAAAQFMIKHPHGIYSMKELMEESR